MRDEGKQKKKVHPNQIWILFKGSSSGKDSESTPDYVIFISLEDRDRPKPWLWVKFEIGN